MRISRIPIRVLMGLTTLLCLFIMTGTSADAVAGDAEPLKRVLMISAYSPEYSTFFDQVEGVRKAFEGHNIALDIEFMDTKRFMTPENLENFEKSLSYKMSHYPDYDVVIAADDNALDFVSSRRVTLFPGDPVVFMSINDIDRALEAGRTGRYTGVVESASIQETLAIAVELLPEATEVAVIVDNTPTGIGDLHNFEQAVRSFPALETRLLDLSTMTFEAFRQLIGTVDETSIVLLLSLYSDAAGERIIFQEGIDMLERYCFQPVFHIYENGIGQGLLGGVVVSHVQQGLAAGEMVLRILAGEPVSEIPVVMDSPNQIVFDADVMRQYDLDFSKLPDETILLNDPVSLIRYYWPYLLVVVALVLGEGLIITRLVLTSRERKAFQRELKQSYDALYETNADLNMINRRLRQNEQQIQHLVYDDALSGLKNRFAMTQALEAFIENAALGERVCVMFLDIDNFKNINDTFGHDIGDEVIRSHAEALKGLIGPQTMIGRFGGDEFIILVTNVTDDRMIEFLAAELMALFRQPVNIGESRFPLTVSIGYACFPENGRSSAELIKKADLALYRSKETGKDMVTHFEDWMAEEFAKKIQLQKEIREALMKKAFHLNFQPVISARLGRITAVEALIRWRREDGSMMPPQKLIDCIEEMGLIGQLSEWVLENACRMALRINENRETPIYVSVNISPVHMRDENFRDRILQIVEMVGVDPSWIALEVTETTIIQSFDTSVELLGRLRRDGFRIALDDFGTGYSSLKYFNQLPIDVLKIDKSFIDDMIESEYDQNLVKVIIMLAHQQQTDVIAEGVENRAQMEVLTNEQCDLIQGYYFSKPLDEEGILNLVEDSR